MDTTTEAPGVKTGLTAAARDVVVPGLACAVSGVVVLGLGGRLVMFVSRVLHPEAVGRLTENGNRIGEFTAGGTLGLVLFGGLLSGLVAATIWVVLRSWVPHRWWVIGLGAVAIGGGLLVDADNRDFDILGDTAPDVLVLLCLVFAFGAAVAGVDRFLDARLPGEGTVPLVVYGIVALAGAPLVIPGLVGGFFNSFAGSTALPIWIGIPLWAAGLLTIGWWVVRGRGVRDQPAWMRMVGGTLALLAFAAGFVHVVGEVLQIL